MDRPRVKYLGVLYTPKYSKAICFHTGDCHYRAIPGVQYFGADKPRNRLTVAFEASGVPAFRTFSSPDEVQILKLRPLR